MNFNDALRCIKPIDIEAAKACIAHFDQVAKPVGSLGKMEELLARVAAITGLPEIDIDRKAVAVFCADNGVVKHGVTQTDSTVTTTIAKSLRNNTASVSVMAAACGADVFPIDIGMIDTVSGLQNHKLMHGTDDITEGSAMSREIAEKAVEIGINIVKQLKSKGYHLIATGEAGIGNTTTSSAVCSVLLNRNACEVTGRGAGLDAAGLSRKIAAIEQAIDINKPNSSDPMDVLHKLGGLDIAAMTGVFLGGALYNVPIVMDGFISGVAALLATRLCPAACGYILPSHESGEPGAHFLMKELGLSPVIHADMRLGEGTGAVALLPLLDMAAAVYNNAATFADIQMKPYKRKL